MKNILKSILLNTLAIFLVASALPGLKFGQDFQVLIIAAIVLALINTFIKPFLKILLLPINVITLGLFGWLVNVIVLYLTTLVVPGLEVVPFTLTFGETTLVFSTFLAYIVITFALSATTTLIGWVIN
jgi:putative membrane protein